MQRMLGGSRKAIETERQGVFCHIFIRQLTLKWPKRKLDEKRLEEQGHNVDLEENSGKGDFDPLTAIFGKDFVEDQSRTEHLKRKKDRKENL